MAKRQERLAVKQMQLATEAAERERKLRDELEVLRTEIEADLAWDNLLFAERVRRDAKRFAEAESFQRKAVATFEKVVKRLPDEPQHQYNLVICLGSLADYQRSTGHSEEAEQTLRRSVATYDRVAKDFPEHKFSARPHLGAIRSLAQVLRDQNQHGEAERRLAEEERLLRKATSSDKSYDQQTKEFFPDRIAEIQSCSLKPLPNSVTWLRELADIYTEDGQYQAAVAEYTKAITHDPENADLYQH